jgi:hypothetical protein
MLYIYMIYYNIYIYNILHTYIQQLLASRELFKELGFGVFLWADKVGSPNTWHIGRSDPYLDVAKVVSFLPIEPDLSSWVLVEFVVQRSGIAESQSRMERNSQIQRQNKVSQFTGATHQFLDQWDNQDALHHWIRFILMLFEALTGPWSVGCLCFWQQLV